MIINYVQNICLNTTVNEDKVLGTRLFITHKLGTENEGVSILPKRGLKGIFSNILCTGVS